MDRQKENPNYVLPAANSPLLFEKGDLALNPMISFSDNHIGFDFNSAYKPTNHLGLMANIQIHTSKNLGSSDNLVDEAAYSFVGFELAPGFCKKMNESWMTELFAGGGLGHLENNYVTGWSNINMAHAFLQPAFGYRNLTRSTELGFKLRLQATHYNIEEAYVDTALEAFTNKQLTEITNAPWQYMLQPGLFVRFGNEKIKGQLGINYSYNLSFNDMEAKNFNLSIGVIFKLNVRRKGQTK